MSEKSSYIYGTAKVGDRGQIVIPSKAKRTQHQEHLPVILASVIAHDFAFCIMVIFQGFNWFYIILRM